MTRWTLHGARGLVLVLAIGLVSTSCGMGYGPRVDRSQFVSAKLADDDRTILFTFHRFVYRPATGMRAFPDGGIPKYITDEHVLGVFDRTSGKAQILRDEKNTRWQPGSGTYWVHSSRGSKALITQGGQLRGDTYATDVRYLLLDFVTGSIQELDLDGDLAARGRDAGPIYLIDDAGTLMIETQALTGAKDGDIPELWVRLVSGNYEKVATTDHYETTREGEVYYWVLETRLFMAYSLANGSTRVASEYKPAEFQDVTRGVILSSDRRSVEYGTKTQDAWTYQPSGLNSDALE